MSRLLVVLSDGAQLVGVRADGERDEDGVRVFLRGGAEVARARPGQRVVVRDVAARPCARRSFPAPAGAPTLAAAVG